MAAAQRIDVHHHIVPKRYRQLLQSKGIRPGGVDVPEWSASRSLDVMDGNGITTAILSLSTPGAWLDNDAQARRLAREANEESAEVVRERPRRFGFFATLTLPDVTGAIAEADHALDVLGADGIVLLTSTQGRYVYEPAFGPLLDHLHQRDAVVFLHPGELPAPPAPGVPAFTADFLLETVRAATGLVMSGSLERYSGIRWILSHAGGFLPYISHRILLTMLREESRPRQIQALARRRHETQRRLDLLRRFYFDVALSSSPIALPSLLALADPSHVLYGSDFPFAPKPAVGFMRREYEDARLDSVTRAAIDRRNAQALFPRLAD